MLRKSIALQEKMRSSTHHVKEEDTESQPDQEGGSSRPPSNAQEEEKFARWNTFKRNQDKWGADLGVVSHQGPNGQMHLDVFPIYRTLECGASSVFNQGYHPYMDGAENDKRYMEAI